MEELNGRIIYRKQMQRKRVFFLADEGSHTLSLSPRVHRTTSSGEPDMLLVYNDVPICKNIKQWDTRHGLHEVGT